MLYRVKYFLMLWILGWLIIMFLKKYSLESSTIDERGDANHKKVVKDGYIFGSWVELEVAGFFVTFSYF